MTVRTFKRKTTRRFGYVAAATCLAMIPASATQAESGGMGPGGPTGSSAPETVPGAKAKIVDGGKAVAPANAPEAVKKVIAAANKIEDKPYLYGGGHGSFKDKGYDCSGAASYALHGGGLLKAPIDSNGMATYGEPGKGKWISVYGAPSHGYIVVAGLRFDTSMTPGNGPGWSRSMRATAENYRVRHPKGL
jgi:cell wall-associated NlpC family hydrolase